VHRLLSSALCVFACLGLTACGRTSNIAADPKSVTKETLVWSDEFNSTAPQSQPNPANWTYDTGGSGWGNHELETYCAWNSSAAPCDPSHPNAYVGNDGYPHIVARSLGNGAYTSARLKSEGLQSFQYGRLEARLQIPQGQGMWPAFWMLGDNEASVPWPACGEFDIMENIGNDLSTIYGSIHGTGFTGNLISNRYSLPDRQSFAAGFHTYGLLWSPQKIQFYVDRPGNVYATETPASLPPGAVWPFAAGKFFFLLNLAVGGDWPGSPNAATQFPQQLLVDFVRVYAEPGDPVSALAPPLRQ
jgi:beta-glucanase (GH16 family)